MRLIDADALMELARNHANRTVDCNDIARFPAIDAVPVVHAWWEYNPGDNIPYCSRCAMPQDVQTKYCHECGAKMDGGKA